MLEEQYENQVSIITDEFIINGNYTTMPSNDCIAELAQTIERGFIYGPYGNNIHMQRSLIYDFVYNRVSNTLNNLIGE